MRTFPLIVPTAVPPASLAIARAPTAVPPGSIVITRTATPLAVALAVVISFVVAPRQAHADVGVGLIAQATRYADRSNSVVGANVELSLDRDRFQYLAELSFARVSFGKDAAAAGLAGAMLRGAVGIRYTVRRFSVRPLDFDLGFEAIAALQDIEWRVRARAMSGSVRDVRPELAAGFSWSFVFERRYGFRTSVRTFFTSSPTGGLACSGSCPADDVITSGLMIVTGVTW